MSYNIQLLLFIYLLGSVLVILLILAKLIIFYVFNWITKANILDKNLKKLQKEDKKEWYLNLLIFLGKVLFEASLSWMNVVFVLWQILAEIFKGLRDSLSPTPEEIKKLRFPLRNNPALSKEAVWAYSVALGLKTGEALPNENVIIGTIDEVLENRPDFNYRYALNQLDNLKVLSSETIASIKNHFDLQNIDDD